MERPEDKHIEMMNEAIGVEDTRSEIDKLAENHGARTRAERRAFRSEYRKFLKLKKKHERSTG